MNIVQLRTTVHHLVEMDDAATMAAVAVVAVLTTPAVYLNEK